MINNVEEHEKESENLKASVLPCETFRQPACCEFYKNTFDILGYAVLIRLCADILEEAKNTGQILLSMT